MALLLVLLLEFIFITNSQVLNQNFDYFGAQPWMQYHRGGIVGIASNRLEFRNVLVQVKQPKPEGHDIQQMFTDIFNWNNDLTKDDRFSDCPVPNISEISAASPKTSFFFGLNPAHRMAAGMLRRIIMGGKNLQEVVCLAGALRDLPGINSNAWVRGVFGAHLTHSGLSGLTAPPLVEVMPGIFLTREALQTARNQGTGTSAGECSAVVDGAIGRDNAEENLLWYFREDLQVNAFHLNWHLIYPIASEVKADRQGELFYFTHHSHLARYRAERLSTGLSPLTPLHIDYNVPIEPRYNPHLDDATSGMSWTPRDGSRVFVEDTLFEPPTANSNTSSRSNAQAQSPSFISVGNQSLLVSRVQDSILRRALLLPNGGIQPINSVSGIDLLGDLVEATAFTINGNYYGSFGFHNEGHVLIGFIQDPQNVTNRPPGVMAEVATAMRDPVFYRYHAAVDETFTLHKELLPPYAPVGGEFPLKWEKVWVERVEVEEQRDGLTRPINELTTFFTQTSYELSRGLDFQRSGRSRVTACVQHLDHNPFTYRIYARRRAQHRLSPNSAPTMATVRIFMAPRYDENGRRYTLLEQRHLFFIMDLFTVSLTPGLNLITRLSTESSLTTSRPSNGTGNANRATQFCGCGWPQHMLIPRGTEAGMDFDLFVMLTNGNQDVVASSSNASQTSSQGGACGPAPIYCGRMNDTYPDARPMNYPFDRLPYTVVETTETSQLLQRYVHDLDEYVHPIPNMANVKVTITHLGLQTPTPTPAPERATNSNANQPTVRVRGQEDGVQGQFEISQHFLNVPSNEINEINDESGDNLQRSSRLIDNQVRKQPTFFSSFQSQNSKSTTYFSNPFMQYSYTL